MPGSAAIHCIRGPRTTGDGNQTHVAGDFLVADLAVVLLIALGEKPRGRSCAPRQPLSTCHTGDNVLAGSQPGVQAEQARSPADCLSWNLAAACGRSS